MCIFLKFTVISLKDINYLLIIRISGHYMEVMSIFLKLELFILIAYFSIQQLCFFL
jgi:hypothetical protein